MGKGKGKGGGVTVGETLKHLKLGKSHIARKADYRVCGLLTMIRCLHAKIRWYDKKMITHKIPYR